jgi:hypothetical protein
MYYFAHIFCRLPSGRGFERLIHHHDLLSFHTRLVDGAKIAAKSFRSALDDYFRLAFYPSGLLAELDEGELSMAAELVKYGRPDRDVIWQIINHRMFREIRAIAKGTETLDGIVCWVDLFNRFMECGASAAGDEPPVLRIRFGDTDSFAPHFIRHLVSLLTVDRPCRPLFGDVVGVMEGLLLAHGDRPIRDEATVDLFLGWVNLYPETV